MDAAKNAIKSHLSKHGQNDTHIRENVAPAVQNETISQTQHDREQVAVDREVHQHHYHTTEQPVSHSETLPEQHHHRAIPIEKREFSHGDHEASERRAADEAAQYKSTSTRVEGEKTHSREPVLAGEHVHHHVHETIQPIVHKQTVEPHVVHTTVPIHEVHHNEAKHHATSALPAMTMDEFKHGGGSLKGREEREDFFPGEPKKFAGESGTGSLGLTGHGANPKVGDSQLSGREGNLASSGAGVGNNSSLSNKEANLASSGTGVGNNSSLSNKEANLASSGTGVGNNSSLSNKEANLASSNKDSSMANKAANLANERSDRSGVQPSDTSLNSGSTTTKKASLLDKLNPAKDADGDGKKGFMS